MRIYAFDEVGSSLHLLPMAARRALDHCGLKLSLAAWRSLPLETRHRLIELGADEQVDTEVVARISQLATPAPTRLAQSDAVDPSAESAPSFVVQAFISQGTLPDKLWQSLSVLDRYTLAKVAVRVEAREQAEAEARISTVWQEIIGHSATSTHLAPQGGVRMIDVGAKAVSRRRAAASSAVSMNAEAFGRLQRADAPKGDVLGAARIAGILAAKRTSELIPLCHPLALTKIELDLQLNASAQRVEIVANVETTDRTGVEMEALVAANVAALTVYDMLKAFDRGMVVGPTLLQEKTGGRSGDFHAAFSDPPGAPTPTAAGQQTATTPHVPTAPIAAGQSASQDRLCAIRESELSVEEVLASVKHPHAGAVALFIGDVRDHNAGLEVTLLEYEAYVSMAVREMRLIIDELEREIPGVRLAAVHRIGTLKVGDTAILCAASSSHRAEAFQAGRELIDRIKQRVPVWKREHGRDGPYWVGWEDARVAAPEVRALAGAPESPKG